MSRCPSGDGIGRVDGRSAQRFLDLLGIHLQVAMRAVSASGGDVPGYSVSDCVLQFPERRPSRCG